MENVRQLSLHGIFALFLELSCLTLSSFPSCTASYDHVHINEKVHLVDCEVFQVVISRSVVERYWIQVNQRTVFEDDPQLFHYGKLILHDRNVVDLSLDIRYRPEMNEPSLGQVILQRVLVNAQELIDMCFHLRSHEKLEHLSSYGRLARVCWEVCLLYDIVTFLQFLHTCMR